MELKVKIVNSAARDYVPRYMSADASGMDVCACVHEPVMLLPLQRALIPTGLAVSIPQGFEIQVRPRSGLAIKHGITLVNTPGTIDADYRGEIKLIVINLGAEPFEITHGLRLAQLVLAPVIQATVVTVDELDETVRGAGGFGHTGIIHS